MKKSYINLIGIGISVFALLLSGCTKMLDQKDPNRITPNNFWQNASDANANLTAVYSNLHNYYFDFLIPMGFRGDDVQVTFGSPAYSQFNQFTMTEANSTVNTAWDQNYKGIFLANQAITYIPGIKMDEALKSRMVGEAKFLRAYYYMNLVLEYKNIPLVTTIPTSTDQYNVSQASPAEVWAQIEKDLTDAIAVLPVSYGAADLGRVTKGAALGFLGKCQLFQQKWQESAKTLAEVINANTYRLLPNFGDVFLEKNDFSAESLFEINFAAATFNGTLEGDPANQREAFSQASGWYIYWPTQWLFDEMSKEKTTTGARDPRLYNTIIFPNDSMTYYGVSYKALMGTATSLAFGKYSEWEYAYKVKVNSGKNRRLLRYADILLMYAEALNRLDQTASAIPYVNMVRNRAKLSSLPATINKTDLNTEIEHQRVLEFAGEGNRFFDLLRWGGSINGTLPIKEVLKAHGAIGTDNFVPGKHEYLPIPLDELQTNNKVKQNPGY